MADIISLATLVVIVGYYTGHTLPPLLAMLPGWLTDKGSLSLILLFLFLFSLKNLAGYFIVKSQNRFVYEVASRMADNNLHKFLDGSFTEYVSTDSAVHVRKIGQLPVEYCHYILSSFQQIITESILVLMTITAILFYNAQLFVLLFIFLLPPVFLLAYFLKKKLKDARQHIKTSGEITMQYLHEALSSYVESNIYDRKSFFINRFSANRRKLNNYLSEIQIAQGTASRMVEVFAVLGFSILIALHVYLGDGRQGIEIVTIGAFMAAAYKIIPGVVKLLNLSGQIKAYKFTLPEMASYSSKIRNPKNDSHLQRVRFEEVSFHYEGRTVIDKLSFEMKAGDIVGIKGESGIGKTTVLNLLLGFLEAGNGTIYFNEAPVNEMEREQLWNRISYVKQQPFLMHNSILTNITLSENGYDPTQLSYAVEATGLTTFIRQFPEGVHKKISEKGKNISGGQQQRIAIARALYKESDLFVLDEPFNELDPASEDQILQRCKQLSQAGKMIILITHNEKSLSVCTKIISLNES